MLTRPAPLPDELDRGYLGRVMRINGIRSEKDMLAAIFKQFELDQLSRFERAPIEALSKMAGVSTERFTQQHSTLPLRRAVTSFLPDLPHGGSTRRTMLYNSGMLTARSGAYFCPTCVKADVEFHGVAYWRRELQIPGWLWCAKHRTGLHYSENEAAFLGSPVQCLGRADIVPDRLLKESIDDGPVNRFLEICSGLMVRDKPLGVKHVSALLRRRAESKGLETVRYRGRYPLLSDLIRDTYPNDWMATVYPEVVGKVTGQTMVKVDGVLFMGSSASSVWPYLLAIGALYDDADEALNDLFNVKVSVAIAKRQRRIAVRSLSREVLLENYAKHKGRCSAMAKELGLSLSTMKSKLRVEGLPDLTGSRGGCKKPNLAAYAFYIEKKSLTESAQIGGLTMVEMEALIREARLEFQVALRTMWPERQEPARQMKTRKGLSPVAASLAPTA